MNENQKKTTDEYRSNWDKIFKAQEHQSQAQTKYGALFYETPYRGESIYLSDDGSYESLHGREPSSPCLNAHNEQTK